MMCGLGAVSHTTVPVELLDGVYVGGNWSYSSPVRHTGWRMLVAVDHTANPVGHTGGWVCWLIRSPSRAYWVGDVGGSGSYHSPKRWMYWEWLQ